MNKKRKVTKRVAAWLLCLAMVMTAINLPAFSLTVKAAEPAIEVSSWGELASAISSVNNGDTIKLVGDVIATEADTGINIPSKSFTIDLNGYKIDRNLTSASTSGCVFWIYYGRNSELTIIDSSEAKTGTITGGYSTGNGGAIGLESGNTLKILGGTITGNKAEWYGGGIFADCKNATLILGGTAKVVGNTAKEEGDTEEPSNIHLQNNEVEHFKVGTGDEALVQGTAKIGIRFWLGATIPNTVCDISDEATANCFEADNAGCIAFADNTSGSYKLAIKVHTHDYNGDTSCKATCIECGKRIENGTHNYNGDISCKATCIDCGKRIENGTHNFNGNTSCQATCIDCGSYKTESAHNFDSNDNCTVCGIKKVSKKSDGVYVDNQGLEYSLYEGKMQVGVNNADLSDYAELNVIIPEKIVSGELSYDVFMTKDGAFTYCKKLKSIQFAKGITSIPASEFDGCTGLTSITIPDTVTVIGNSAFNGCTSLTSITIPDTVTVIGNSAFKDCTSLTSITIPNTVTEIGRSAFEKCGSLECIVIPEGVTCIDERCFFGCSSLKKVSLPKGLNSIETYAFVGCRAIKSIVIPDTVTTISSYAFSLCDSLESVTIPSSVKTIKSIVFHECSKDKLVLDIACTPELRAVPVLDWGDFKTINWIHDYEGQSYSPDADGIHHNQKCKNCEYVNQEKHDFSDDTCQGTCTICGATNVAGMHNFFNAETNEYQVTCVDCGTANSNKCGDTAYYVFDRTKTTLDIYGTGKISNSAFVSNGNIEKVTIHKGITQIGDSAFLSCENLSEVNLPDRLEAIGAGAFAQCKLHDIIIPSSVETIGNDALAQCKDLASVTVYCNTDIDKMLFGPSWTSTFNTPTTVKCVKGSKQEEYFKTNYDTNISNKTLILDTNSITHAVSEYVYVDAEKHEMTCSLCREIVQENHDFSHSEYQKDVAGKHYQICALCQAESEKVDCIAGTPVRENVVDATCTEDGSYDEVTYCTVCEQELSRDKKTITKTGHKFTTYTSNDDATCTENATETAKCDNEGCSETDTRKIADSALGHHYVFTKYDWKTDGSACDIVMTCDRDGCDSVEKHIATITSKVTKDATCKEKGTTTYTAAYETYTDTLDVDDVDINPDNHQGETEIKDKKEATCGETGYTGDTYCKDCGEKLSSGTSIDKKAHVWDEGIITTEPTCTEAGVRTYTCLNDASHTKTEVEPKLGHDFAESFTVDKEPTYTEKGSKSRHCSRCDATTDVTEIPMLVKPSTQPTVKPSEVPSTQPTVKPSEVPSTQPTVEPSTKPSTEPSQKPSVSDNDVPTATPTPSQNPSVSDNDVPTATPSPSQNPSVSDNDVPTATPSPSQNPSVSENDIPTVAPSEVPSETPSEEPSSVPSEEPSAIPSETPSELPSENPSAIPSEQPSVVPSVVPTTSPSIVPSVVPSMAPSVEPSKVPAVGDVSEDKATNGNYQVTAAETAKKEVTYTKPVNKQKTSYKIPDTVKIDGVVYKITKIEKNAFKNNTKVKTITAGKNIKLIGANAFKGCKKLKTLTIKSTKLTSGSVAKNAFKGITKATTIKVPKKKLKAYKTLFQKKGLSKSVKVKAI